MVLNTDEYSEEEADVKDVLPSEEKKGLDMRKKSFSAKMDVIMEKFGTQDRLEIDKLDSNITANIESMTSLIENLENACRKEMAKVNFIEQSEGYGNILDKSTQIKNVIGSLKTIIAGMIQQNQYLNISVEYINTEKDAILEKLKTNKNSEVVLQVIEKQEQINNAIFERQELLHKQTLENTEKLFMRQINSLHAQLDKAHGITLDVSESSLSEKEIELAEKVLKSKPAPKPKPKNGKTEEPKHDEDSEGETEEEQEREEPKEKEKFSEF